jgi:chromosome segregation ATPase
VLSSSKGDSKQEARFAARLDVLMERVDTLASTVATTASAMAKKDGEIASLRRDLEARDQAVQALAAQAQATRGTAERPATDINELRSLKNAVAALMKERADGSPAHVEDLAASVRALGQRFEELSATVSTTAARGAVDPQVTERVDALDVQLASIRASLEHRESEPDRPSDELVAMLATLRSQVEALGGLASGAKDEHLDRRITDVEDAIAQLAERIDSLATGVESATTSLGAKEHELAALHSHFTESSTRIESIVDDIREALSALPEPGSASLDDLDGRLERVEASTRKASETNARMANELTGRIDVIDQRVAAVAAEVARAKTLWPVALRSLEARLDDAVHGHRPESSATDDTASTNPPDGPADDLLAGLRDSLQAMETVAAEMARASDTLGDPDDRPGAEEPAETETPVATAGATIVPLRTGEP